MFGWGWWLSTISNNSSTLTVFCLLTGSHLVFSCRHCASRRCSSPSVEHCSPGRCSSAQHPPHSHPAFPELYGHAFFVKQSLVCILGLSKVKTVAPCVWKSGESVCPLYALWYYFCTMASLHGSSVLTADTIGSILTCTVTHTESILEEVTKGLKTPRCQ